MRVPKMPHVDMKSPLSNSTCADTRTNTSGNSGQDVSGLAIEFLTPTRIVMSAQRSEIERDGTMDHGLSKCRHDGPRAETMALTKPGNVQLSIHISTVPHIGCRIVLS